MIKLFATPNYDLQNLMDNITEPAEIYLSNGVYRQKIQIKTPNVTIIGESRDKTILTFDDYAKKIHTDGKEYNTFRTYTLCVATEGVKLENLTVENSNTDPASAGQCVALSVNCKKFCAENVNLKSMQDTLFLSPFPDDLVLRYRGFIPENQLYLEGNSLHFFKNCKISGTVDFIFGCAEAYFIDCEIVSLYEARGTGFIAAPAHPLAQEHGFYFIDCNLISDGAAVSSVYLARPWRDFGKCAFINCKAGKHVNGELFDKWNDTDRDKTARFSYCNLDFETAPSPVKWSKELENEEVNTIIKRCTEKFNRYFR